MEQSQKPLDPILEIYQAPTAKLSCWDLVENRLILDQLSHHLVVPLGYFLIHLALGHPLLAAGLAIQLPILRFLNLFYQLPF